MKNLKKVLALVLVVAMIAGFAVSASAYTDKAQITANYDTAVELLDALDVIGGYTDGSYKPSNNLSRGAYTKMVTKIMLGGEEPAASYAKSAAVKFSDVAATDTFAPYIGYAVAQGIIDGYSDGTFRAGAPITGAQAAKLTLGALGYDSSIEGYTGTNWDLRVMDRAEEVGLFDGFVASFDAMNALTREEAAQLFYNALFTSMNYYDVTKTVNSDGSYSVTTKALYPTLDTVEDYLEEIGVALDGISYTMNGYTITPSTLLEYIDELTTLGFVKFGLIKAYTADNFGRPTESYFALEDIQTSLYQIMYGSYTNQFYFDWDPILTVAMTPVYTTTVAVSGCDLNTALGTSAATVESYYVDGICYSDKYATAYSVVPDSATTMLGAQGMLLEVYDMGKAGYRGVCINTYLASVVKVVADTTDSNGHTVKGYSVLDVNYAEDEFDSVLYWKSATNPVRLYCADNTLTKGDAVLVTISEESYENQAVESAEAASIVELGTLTKLTNKDDSATFTSGEYKFAQQYYLGSTENTIGASYIGYFDAYGNLIGTTDGSKNYYCVVEKMAYTANGLNGGYATANIRLADGTLVENAKIVEINGYDIEAAAYYSIDATSWTAYVSSDYQANGWYYGFIWQYTTTTDGDYVLVQVAGDQNVRVDSFEADTLVFNDGDGKVYTNDETVFLIAQRGKWTYEVYTGNDTIPSIDHGKVDYITNVDGYATLVVVDSSYEYATNTFFAYYVPGAPISLSKLGSEYEVYKVGETEATSLYITDETEGTLPKVPGLVMFTVNTDNQIETVVVSVNINDSEYTDEKTNVVYSYETISTFQGNNLVVNSGDAYETKNAKFFQYTSAGMVEITADDVKEAMADAAYESTTVDVIIAANGETALNVYLMPNVPQ